MVLLPDRRAPHVGKTIGTRKPPVRPGCECIPLPGRASTRPRRLLRVHTPCIVVFTQDVSTAPSVHRSPRVFRWRILVRRPGGGDIAFRCVVVDISSPQGSTL